MDYKLLTSQSVAVEGYDSSVLPVVSGVPQGSVLGPLLFITYINNVTSVVFTESELNLFADDIALYRIIKTTADYTPLQNDIDSISSFISGKHLKFNAKKCRQMLGRQFPYKNNKVATTLQEHCHNHVKIGCDKVVPML